MAEILWSDAEVQGFTAKLGDFYDSLSPAGRQIFTDMLHEEVRGSDDVAGYLQIEPGQIPAAVLAPAVAEFLMARARA